jgi:Virulence activator alpha C-term
VGAGVAAVLAGVGTACESDASGGADRPGDTPAPEPDPDGRIRSTLAAGSERLLRLYAATTRQHRKLRTELEAYEKRHREHLAVLADLRKRADAARGATPTPTPTGKAIRIEIVRPASQAVAALIDAERTLHTERLELLGDIADPELARVVASIVACGWTHERELAELDG